MAPTRTDATAEAEAVKIDRFRNPPAGWPIVPVRGGRNISVFNIRRRARAALESGP